jgi:hypothetical protein
MIDGIAETSGQRVALKISDAVAKSEIAGYTARLSDLVMRFAPGARDEALDWLGC